MQASAGGERTRAAGYSRAMRLARVDRTASVRFHRWATTTVLSVAAISGCTRTVSEVDLQKAEISLAEVKAVVDAAARDRRDLLIDPRPIEDYEKGRIPGARRLELGAVSGINGQTDPALERYRSLIVYGNDPATASARAMAKKLMATGYARVRYFVGGLGEWTRAGYPVETGPAGGGGAP